MRGLTLVALPPQLRTPAAKIRVYSWKKSVTRQPVHLGLTLRTGSLGRRLIAAINWMRGVIM
jgi:hypothetical protein